MNDLVNYCPNCDHTLEYQYGGERGESGPFGICVKCDYNEEDMNNTADMSFANLSSAAQEVMSQLFLNGPLWDGNISSKSGRNELCKRYLVSYTNGWTFLTQSGVYMAINADVKNWSDRRFYQKQQCL